MVDGVEARDGGTRLTNRVHVGEHLSAGDLAPNVAGAQFAEVHLTLHLGAQLLEVLVGQRDADHADQGGHRGQAHTEEGQGPQGLGLLALLLLVIVDGGVHCAGTLLLLGANAGGLARWPTLLWSGGGRVGLCKN